jgi:hypothetical protein
MNEAAARHRNRTRNEPNNIVWEFITLLAGSVCATLLAGKRLRG